MHYYTTVASDQGGASKTSYVYDFGAPSHGKCWNDGIGGCYKRKIDQECSSSMTSVGVLNYTDTGYITNVRDVYLSLVHHFQRGEHRDRQLSGQNPIRAHRFFVTPRRTTLFPDQWKHLELWTA